MMTEVWYLLFNSEQKFLVQPSRVKVKDIYGLKEAVEAKKNIEASDLVVWRCKEPVLLSTQDDEDLQENLSKIDLLDKKKVAKLPSGAKLANLELGEDEILLVQVPDLSFQKRNFEEEEEKPLNKFLKARELDISAARRAPCPSSAARVTAFDEEQEKRPVWNGRPLQYHAEPLGLFHPVFNEFQNNIMDNQEPFDADAATYISVRNFFLAMSQIHKLEKSRARAIIEPLQALLGRRIMVVRSEKVESDGVVTWTCDLFTAYLVVLEIKNEIGTGHADPYNQGSLAYRKYCTAQADLIRRCCCPSIILAIAGPWLCVIGGVYLDKAITQPLTDYVWFGGDPYNSKRQVFAARLFAALKSAISRLEYYYETLRWDRSHSTISPYPFITEYGAQKTGFTYVSRLAGYDSHKLVYKATLNDVPHTPIVVKFVERYNAHAHRLLADHNLAPKLHYSSIEDNLQYGERYMIVMDYVDLEPPSGPLTQPQYKSVEGAIKILHSHNLVFGDLRKPNILVENNDTTMIIDFDWCGEAGKDKYPPDINPDPSIGWHVDVGPGCLMSFDHDIYMLNKLKL